MLEKKEKLNNEKIESLYRKFIYLYNNNEELFNILYENKSKFINNDIGYGVLNLFDSHPDNNFIYKDFLHFNNESRRNIYFPLNINLFRKINSPFKYLKLVYKKTLQDYTLIDILDTIIYFNNDYTDIDLSIYFIYINVILDHVVDFNRDSFTYASDLIKFLLKKRLS